MTLGYTRHSSFNKEELSWAIDLIEKEHDREDRNTPEKMAKLITENFDIMCIPSDILNLFDLNEKYELKSKTTEYYDSKNYINNPEHSYAGNPHR